MKDVLIVEDDRQTLDALVKVLSKEGYAARGAGTAQGAMSEIDRQSPDILISDWDLGSETTGIHVVIHAMQCNPSVHLIMISGNHLQKLQYETRELPIHDYISKPFSLSDIRLIVGKAI